MVNGQMKRIFVNSRGAFVTKKCLFPLFNIICISLTTYMHQVLVIGHTIHASDFILSLMVLLRETHLCLVFRPVEL